MEPAVPSGVRPRPSSGLRRDAGCRCGQPELSLRRSATVELNALSSDRGVACFLSLAGASNSRVRSA